jgi:hypothetical protein
MEISGQVHAPVALPPEETTSDIDEIGGWAGCREHGCKKIKSSAVSKNPALSEL